MRAQQDLQFHSFDGQPLFYRHWSASGLAPTRRAVVLLHRGHEHSGRVAHLADELDLPDTDVFAWDARGNGQSPGERGDAPGFEALVRDLDSFIAHIGQQHGIAVQDIAIIAQSVGAVVAATWVHDYAPPLRALVLASPAFKVKLYVPLAVPGLKLMQKLRGNFFVNSYVKPQWLTHDPERVESYRTDPLITRPISVRVLLGLYEAADRVVGDAQAITVPTQLLVSGSDFVVRRRTASTSGCPRRSRNATCCRASSTTPWASATVRRPSRPSAALSPSGSSSRWCGPACAMRTGTAPPSTRRKSCPGRRSATAPRTCTGASPGPACASAARCPRASRWAWKAASIRAARWTTSTATRRAEVARWAA